MERTNPDLATSEEFGKWLSERLQRAGYDLRPRGGGQRRFAEVSGIGAATLSRLLAGQGVAGTRTLRQISDALNVPFADILVAAGVVSRDELTDVRNPRGPLTAEDAADELGLNDPQSRDLFISMTKTLQEQRQTRGDAADQ
ncbi:helix-turn-helix domain-containing protein [Streptomyces albidoflavus]